MPLRCLPDHFPLPPPTSERDRGLVSGRHLAVLHNTASSLSALAIYHRLLLLCFFALYLLIFGRLATCFHCFGFCFLLSTSTLFSSSIIFSCDLCPVFSHKWRQLADDLCCLSLAREKNAPKWRAYIVRVYQCSGSFPSEAHQAEHESCGIYSALCLVYSNFLCFPLC